MVMVINPISHNPATINCNYRYEIPKKFGFI